MLSYYYQKYKLWFWLMLFVVFESGAVSKSFYADAWQVWLNALTGIGCLIIFFVLALRRKSKADEQTAGQQLEEVASSRRHGRLILIFTALGAIASIAILPYTTAVLGDSMNGIPLPLAGKSAITVAQVTLMTLAASAFGLVLASKVGLDAPLLRYWLYGGKKVAVSYRWIGIGALGSLAGTAIFAMLEKVVFQPNLPEIPSPPSVALWKGALTFLYGGIVEEVLLRLFVMSLLVWIFTRIGSSRMPVPSIYYVCAIVLASILFGLAHLPATMNLYGELTPLLVVRAIVGNGLLGIWFGYLYWKKGLEYAIAAHMAGDIFLHAVLAALLS